MNAVIDLKDVILETDRLILREWQESDLNDFFEYASVDGVGQMAGWRPHKNIEESKFVLDMFIREGKTFAVVLKENNKAIGSVGIEKLSTEIDGYENMTGMRFSEEEKERIILKIILMINTKVQRIF